MPGNMVASIKMCGEQDWKNFFEKLAVEKAMQIRGAKPEELLRIQAQISEIDELREMFLSELRRSPKMS